MKASKWPTVALGELFTTKSGGTPSRENPQFWNGDLPWFSGKDLKSLYLHDSIEHISAAAIGRGTRMCEPNTILVLVRGMTLMKEVPIGILRCRATFNQDVKALVPKDGSVDVRFIAYFLLTENAHLQNLVATSGHGTGRLPLEALVEYPVPKAPLHEQRKIADILTTWDEALEKLDALIAAQERRKKALMQQLLTGKKRFPGFKGKWQNTRLGDVLEPISRPTAKPQRMFLAAGIRSHGKGVFLKPDFTPANIALDELFELKAGDLVVNITFAWEGAAAIVPPEADGALVSHRFPAFKFREGWAARSFFRHYILTKRFIFGCGLASPGGAGRNRVLSKSAFLDLELSLPPIDEQEKIGCVLDAASEELTHLRAQRTAIDQQKCGLMQKLLTGKIRVRGDTNS